MQYPMHRTVQCPSIDWNDDTAMGMPLKRPYQHPLLPFIKRSYYYCEQPVGWFELENK